MIVYIIISLRALTIPDCVYVVVCPGAYDVNVGKFETIAIVLSGVDI